MSRNQMLSTRGYFWFKILQNAVITMEKFENRTQKFGHLSEASESAGRLPSTGFTGNPG